MEDWSLEAIVRGSSGDFENNILDMNLDDPSRPFFQSYDLGYVPDFFEASSDDLEDLYKPFYYPATSALPDQSIANVPENNKAVRDDQPPGTSSGAASVAPKYKKRKNQLKRVVIQVSAEGLSSDMWAWRKYGQKPIKGSPYPRSYYRCSSSKGCLARKQVEESWRDPGMFIITYTAEHSHSKPTRRNSLAGTVRQKFPSKREKSAKTTSGSSPGRVIKEEEMEGRDGGERMSEFDDFFMGLEDFDEFVRQELM